MHLSVGAAVCSVPAQPHAHAPSRLLYNSYPLRVFSTAVSLYISRLST